MGHLVDVINANIGPGEVFNIENLLLERLNQRGEKYMTMDQRIESGDFARGKG